MYSRCRASRPGPLLNDAANGVPASTVNPYLATALSASDFRPVSSAPWLIGLTRSKTGVFSCSHPVDAAFAVPDGNAASDTRTAITALTDRALMRLSSNNCHESVTGCDTSCLI